MTDLDSLAAALNSTAIHLLRRLRHTDASLGVTPARLSALSVLVFGGPSRISDLAAAEQVAGPTMSKIVAGLEADGLVSRRPDPGDGRAVLLTATPKGKHLMERGRALRVGALARELARLEDSEIATLTAATEILRSLE